MGRGRRRSEPLPQGQDICGSSSASAEVKIEGGGVGAFGLQEAPVFYPSEEEFEHPLRYIAQIRPQAEAYGICRIVPPNSWNPPLGLDTVKFTFPTKLQAIHQLQERPAACDADTFKLEYGRFLRRQGEILESWPLLDGEELDLCKFFNAVKRHGGYDKVSSDNKWGEVARLVKSEVSSSPISSSVSSTLRQLYEKHLHTFEVYQAKVGSGKRWRVARKQETSDKQAGKPKRGGRRRQSGGDVDLEACGENKKSEDELVGEAPPMSAEDENRSQPKRTRRRRQQGSEDGPGESKKGQSAETDSGAEGGRLSGEVECRSQSNPPAPRKRRKVDEKFAVPEGLGRTDQICEQCLSGAHEQLMLLCDRCDRGWHLYCLSPPLSSVPVGNWYCLDCIGSESESFGFGQGQEYSFDSFRRMADRFKRKWFGTRPSTYADLEKEFWRVVERGTGPVEVLYGSDLDTGVYGSGFPRATDPVPPWSNAEAWDAGAKSPWNVNNFPKLEGSMLRLVHDNIPGVMVPWLYIGMLFSSFCWHYEDHCFYSVNYLHCGEPKSWYSVPGHAAEAFEKVMQKAFPDLFEAQPDLLFQLVTMLNPTVLRDNGVPVCTTVQEPHNFVITFPRSYHGGFNHGFNCAEAVNFAPSDWLPYGGFGVERYRLYHKAAVLSHDELLCVVAKNDRSCEKSPWLQQELVRIIGKERHQREYLWSIGMVKSSRMTSRLFPDHIGAEEDAECIICRYYLHLSSVVCRCRPGKAVCLQHARQLCECSADQQTLQYRLSLAELDDLVSQEDQTLEDTKVGDLAAAPSQNKRRLRRGHNGTLSSRNPSLKKVKGRFYKHSELADAWLTQARAAGRNLSRSPILEELLTQAEQFLWGGHEMDQVRSMVEQLTRAHKWVQDVAACSVAVDRYANSNSGKAIKVPLATVQELLAVDPIPWVEPHLPKLKALLEPACNLKQKIIDALNGVPSPHEIQTLQSLQQEATHSPFELPELQQLKDVLVSAQIWTDRVKKSLSACPKLLRNRVRNELPDLDLLRALQEEGSTIPVMFGEKTLLESFVGRVENWEERASQLLASDSSLEELEEVFRDSESLPIRSVKVELLEERLQRAQSWIQRAKGSVLLVREPSDYGASIKLLRDLLGEGLSLQVRGIQEVGVIQIELEKILWMHNTSQVLEGKTTIKCLENFIAEATRLQVGDGELIVQIHTSMEDALAWESQAGIVFHSSGSLVEFIELVSAAERIKVELPTLNQVQKAISEAESWLSRAHPFCSASSKRLVDTSSISLDLSTLQILVADSRSLLVTLDEVNLLSTTLAAAQSWVAEACILKGAVLVSQKVENQSGLSQGITTENVAAMQHRASDSCSRKGIGEMAELTETSKILQEDLVKLDEAVNQGLSFGLHMPEVADLQGLSAATKWSLKALDLVRSSPSVKEVEKHLEDAASMPVKPAQFALLQRILSDAKAWLQDAATFLPGIGIKDQCTEEQLEQLITDSQLLPVSVASEAACLEDILTSHRTWKKKVQHALSGAVCLTWSELLLLQETGEANMVKNEMENVLNHEVVGVGSWILKCHEAITRQPGYNCATLEELLVKMQKSVEYAIQKLETNQRNDTEREATCICGQTVEADSSLLQCDRCWDRYHPSCLGATQAQTRGQKQYTCPYCSAISCGVVSLNEEVGSKLQFPRRPGLHALVEVLQCGKNLQCRIKEKELLETVVKLVHFWRKRLQITIEPALVCQSRHVTVDHLALVGAQKALEFMEIEDEDALMIKKAVAANAWRNRSTKLLDNPSKPFLRPLTRALKEGVALGISGEDCIFQELKQREVSATHWISRAKQVIGDHGRMPLSDVLALIVEGEGLPVSLSKELVALRERSVLYCVCRKPYDEDRAMIACDRCGEWYHFSCINLPEPDGSDEDCDDVIQQECEQSGDFVCPKCKELVSKVDHQKVAGPAATKSSYRNRATPEETEGGNKAAEGSPFYGLVRGKRSNRSSNRSRGETPHKWQSPLFQPGKLLWHTQRRRKQHDEPQDDGVSASGRPCRRTAGRHSGFESFILLMRTR